MSEEHSAYVTLTDSNFDKEVNQFPGAVLVDFWAAWCGPCIMMEPRIAELAEKYKADSNIKVAKLNVDEEQETGMAYRIMSLPTFKVFVNGQEVDELIGARNIEDLDNALQRAAMAVKKAA